MVSNRTWNLEYFFRIVAIRLVLHLKLPYYVPCPCINSLELRMKWRFILIQNLAPTIFPQLSHKLLVLPSLIHASEANIVGCPGLTYAATFLPKQVIWINLGKKRHYSPPRPPFSFREVCRGYGGIVAYIDSQIKEKKFIYILF